MLGIYCERPMQVVSIRIYFYIFWNERFIYNPFLTQLFW